MRRVIAAALALSVLVLLGAAARSAETASPPAAAGPTTRPVESFDHSKFDPSKHPPRKRRSECFLGIHFDLHANPGCREIGRNVTPEMVERILESVKPDYIQVDCKGHRGLSSYPTRVGNPAPGFVSDPLRVWREVTARRGVGLYMHYSGVWDNEALKHHPDWAAIGADGKPAANATSVFGPYADKLLIPQLKELCDVYGVNGAWVDGDCWATVADWSPAAQAAFVKATGIKQVPRKNGEPHWLDYMEFCRAAFRDYVKHYVEALKAHDPRFQVISNWAYSDHMPEAVRDVECLSGDYSMQDSVNSARFSGRCLANQNAPWDLMAWAFSCEYRAPGRSIKSVPQLQREAAVVLSLGGGFQAYFKQKNDLSIYDWQMKLMAETARFCRARQALCHKTRDVPQIGLLYSRAAIVRKTSGLYSLRGQQGPMRGVLQCLLEGQHCVDVVMEHQLEPKRLAEFPLIVVPEWEYLEPAFKARLVEYVRGGGNVLLIGPAPAALFAKELDVTFAAAAQTTPVPYIEQDGWLAGQRGAWRKVRLGKTARPFGRLYMEDDPRSSSQAAASITPLGKGRLAAVYVDVGDAYLRARTFTSRNFLSALVRELMPAPLVEVTGSHSVDVTPRRKDGQLRINLVNTAGPHEDKHVYVFDDIPPVGPLQVALRPGRRPARLRLEPAGLDLPFTWADGVARFTVPRVEIHEVIVVD